MGFLKRFTLENPTDVFEQTDPTTNSWVVFSNASQHITVRFPTYQSNITIRVTDMLGREIAKQEQESGVDITLQTTQLPHGMYVVHITNGKSTQSKTILL